MFKFATKWLAVLSVFCLLGVLFIAGYALGRFESAGSAGRFALLNEVQGLIESSAVDQPEEDELLQGAARGMVRGLNDPYASYLTPEAYRAFGEEVLDGQYSGVGIWLNLDDLGVLIVAVVPGGPADGAGIVPGERVAAVDGEPVGELDLDEVARRILGETGTEVTLELVGEDGEPRELTLERDRIDIPVVDSRMEGDVGIVQLLSFSGNAGNKVRDAVAQLEREGAQGFVLDMRGNPGGSLVESVEVASVFLDGGVIVSYQERGQSEKVFEASPPVGTNLPLVVLVDQGSASASEIVAAAIQERDRGTIVGTSTYGKGSVQQVFGLSDGSAVKLTVASYFTPSGQKIGEDGVEPDVVVEDREQQLPRAIEELQSLLADQPAAAAS